MEGFARSGLSHWATWRWHWEKSANSSATKTRDHGGGAKRLAPVRQGLEGDPWKLSVEAAKRAGRRAAL